MNQHAVYVLHVADEAQAEDARLVEQPQDLQNTGLVIDIGDNRTVKIILRGKLTLQGTGPQADAAAAARLNNDKKFIDRMRGWLMTVATLFTGIAFQAAMQPPSWIPPDWYHVLKKQQQSFPPAATPGPGTTTATAMVTRAQALRALNYVLINTLTFAISLGLVVVLVVMRNSKSALLIIRVVSTMVVFLCATVGYTFAVGNSYDPAISSLIAFILVSYGLGTLLVFSAPFYQKVFKGILSWLSEAINRCLN